MVESRTALNASGTSMKEPAMTSAGSAGSESGASRIGKRRGDQIVGAIKTSTKLHDPAYTHRTFETDDGRTGYRYWVGMGPGGGLMATALPTRDSRYDLVIFTSFDTQGDTPADQIIQDPVHPTATADNAIIELEPRTYSASTYSDTPRSAGCSAA